jgi:hypothetical protein
VAATPIASADFHPKKNATRVSPSSAVGGT